MKKLLSLLILVAIVFGNGASFASAATNSNKVPACIAFDETLYYAKDTWIRTTAVYSNKKEFKEAEEKITPQVARLHEILIKEGFTISSKEKDLDQFGVTTAIAVAGLQNKYKAELLTSQGLTYSHGVFDAKAIQFINQKYPCPTGTVTPPTTSTASSTGVVRFSNAGDTLRLKEGTLLNARYALTKASEYATTTFSYINKATGVETVVRTVKQKNGRYLLDTYVPVPGTYTVRAKVQDGKGVSELKLVSIASTTSTSNTSSNNSSGSNSGSSGSTGSDSDLSTDGTNNSYKVKVTSPSSSTSIKAGAVNAVLVKGEVENISNSAKVALYLVSSTGTETKLRDGSVYACSNNYCSGLGASTGMRTTIPSGTAAGTYKIKAVVTVNGVTVSDTSDSFTVTN